jgi:excisionase family DNA binding protein
VLEAVVSDLGSALLAQLDDDVLAELATRLAPFLPRPNSADDDGWLNTREAAKYLGITANALHKLTAARAIPFEQEGPNAKCWFRRSELDAWRRGTREAVRSRPSGMSEPAGRLDATTGSNHEEASPHGCEPP